MRAVATNFLGLNFEMAIAEDVALKSNGHSPWRHILRGGGVE
jgi:hypothetical protein